MATFRCDGCGHAAQARNELVGKKARCPKCGQIGQITLPESDILDFLSPSGAAPPAPKPAEKPPEKPAAVSAPSPVAVGSLQPVPDSRGGLPEAAHAATRRCPRCGGASPATARFCPDCGTHMGQETGAQVSLEAEDAVRFVGSRELALQAMIETMTDCGGTIEPGAAAGWALEARWEHPTNPDGLRVRAALRPCQDGSVHIRVAGGFKSALVSSGPPRAKAREVLDRFVQRFGQAHRGEHEKKPCPNCGQEIFAAGKKCRHCGAYFG